MTASIDPAKAKRTTAFNHPATLYGLAVDPAGGRLYAGADDYGVHVFDLAAEKKESVARWAGHDNFVSAVVCLGAGAKRQVVSASYDRRLIWWDADKGEPVRTVDAHDGWVRDLAATPDGGRLVSVGDDMRVKVWEADTGKPIRSLEGHAKQTPQGHVTALYAVAVSADGKYAASGDRIGDVRVWELDTGTLAESFQTPILYTYDPKQRKRSLGGVRSLAFSPDGELLAVGGMGQAENVDGLSGQVTVEVWDWRSSRRRFTGGAQGHKGSCDGLVFHPGGAWLLGGGGGEDGGFLAVWPADAADDKKPVAAAQRFKTDGHFHRCRLDAAGGVLYAAGFHKLEVWDLGA